jgi:hypothetical protein
MKKQILFLLGMLTVTFIMAQTPNTAVNKDGTNDTIYKHVLPGIPKCECGNQPMSTYEFSKLLTDIKNKGTDPLMFSFAKQEIRDKCLLTSQVEEIVLAFMYDIYRYDFLILARNNIYDRNNYSALRLKIKYLYHPVNSQDYGQLHNPTEFKQNQYPGKYINELNQNYIPNGRIVEIERDNYYRGGSPPE